jgi:putative heme transporter
MESPRSTADGQPSSATSGEPPADEAAPPSPKARRKKIIQGILSIGLGLAMIVFVLPQIADLSEVWQAIRDMTALEMGVLLLFAAWNLVTYWVLLIVATPGLTFGQSVVVTETTTAVSNTVPAGGAVSIGLTYGMLGSWGFSKSRITVSVLVTGIWNNFAKLGMPIIAVALLMLEGGAGGGRIISALVGLGALVTAIVIFALILRSEDFAARIGLRAQRVANRIRRVFRKGPASGYDLAVVKFRSRIIGLVRHRWISLTFWTVVGHFSLYAVLLVALRQIGVSDDEVSWTKVLAVFAFARLLTAIPLTPGGLGVIELALIAGLDTSNVAHSEVVGAVLLFRLLTYVIPIPFGLATYVFWRRNDSWRNSAPPLPPELSSLATSGA